MNKLKIAVLLPVAALIAFVLSACAPSYATYGQICVSPITHVRMAWTYCTVGNPYYHAGWVYYVRTGAYVPGVGVRYSGYSTRYTHVPPHSHVNTSFRPSTSGGRLTVPKPAAPKVSTNKSSTKTGGGTSYKPKSRCCSSTRLGSRSGGGFRSGRR